MLKFGDIFHFQISEKDTVLSYEILRDKVIFPKKNIIRVWETVFFRQADQILV